LNSDEYEEEFQKTKKGMGFFGKSYDKFSNVKYDELKNMILSINKDTSTEQSQSWLRSASFLQSYIMF
jgi:hypothetical protein